MLSLPYPKVLLCLTAYQIVVFQIQLGKLDVSLDKVDEVFSCLIISEPQEVVSKAQIVQLRDLAVIQSFQKSSLLL